MVSTKQDYLKSRLQLRVGVKVGGQYAAWNLTDSLSEISFGPEHGDKNSFCRGPCAHRGIFMAISATGPGKGGGVLDRPTIEKTTPGRESEFDLRYKYNLSGNRGKHLHLTVLLHNDNFNKREYVVQVLMKVIPGMTLDNAVNIMQEAHYNGLAVVIICAQADAEDHCMQLRGNGLLSSIEPASGGC
ncbi:hypothetical protein Syun_021610 [Stephania yunnanensis]|uniref:Adaptor protein ClpS core domain-containing protein n=1 Tax=Stephania yunnanensis TaxID=152371 RepID=A0AAP0IGX4_9MAGN